MPFIPKDWKDYPETSTPIGADALKDLEQRVYDAAVADGDKFYQHTQSTPSDTWEIEHNLGKKPSVTIVDFDGITTVGNRSPKHQHTVYDPGHNHSFTNGTTAAANFAGSGGLQGAQTTITGRVLLATQPA